MAKENHNHLVFGAGLIGSYIGAVLSKQANQVHLFGRQDEYCEKALHISDYLGEKANLMPVIYPLKTLMIKTHYSFLWLCVKCSSIQQAIVDMKPLLAQDTIILCCQNGLDSNEIVKQAFPENRVLQVMVSFNVAQLGKDRFHKSTEGNLTIESNLPSDTILKNYSCDLLPIQLSTSMSSVMWAKLQLNLSNSVNALSDIPVKSMLEDRAYRKLIAGLMKELLKVCEALDIALPRMTAVPAKLVPIVLALPNFAFKRIAQKMLSIDPYARTSMWHDLTQNKTTEIDFLNGKVVEYGAGLGVPTPLNKKIVWLVKQAEKGELKIGLSGKTLLNLVKNGDNLST